MTVVVPTLVADSTLEDCLLALERQTRRDFEVTIVDNSGQGRVRRTGAASRATRVIENDANRGFGAAVNQALAESRAAFLAVLNDDAAPHPGWLNAMVRAMEQHAEAGMCAPQIRLAGGVLDSAGMLISGDGSSKQRGHRRPPEEYSHPGNALFPSGCAAMYRRAMLDEIGGFDERFFLYCEDADLGLRARWAGWDCLYVPDAVVEHRYSHSAGEASPLKAWLVERNRVFLVLKNFPLRLLLAVPWYAVQRYFWHLVSVKRGQGAAAKFRRSGNGGLRLAWYVIRAHVEAALSIRRLWSERRRIRQSARLTPAEFARLLRAHPISPKQVAAQ